MDKLVATLRATNKPPKWFAASKLRNRSLCSTALQKFHQSLPFFPINTAATPRDRSAMENRFQDRKEGWDDPAREGLCKECCDSNSNRVSDHIIPHILNLYSSATPHDFIIYAPNATFEDPLMCAHGITQIKSAFYSLAKVFGESRIVEYSVKEHQISPGKHEILIDNKQHYKIMGRNIDMISLIKLSVEGGKVVRHEDWWDKKPIWNRDTVQLPLAGRAMELVRRGSMLATHALMRFGKDPTV